MKHRRVLSVIAVLVLLAIVLGCAGPSKFLVPQEEFAKVKVLAFPHLGFAEGIYLGTELAESSRKNAQVIAERLILNKLNAMGDRFSLVNPDDVDKAFNEALAELQMPSYPLYDVQTGKPDDAKNTAFRKYLYGKVKADGILDVSFIKGSKTVSRGSGEVWMVPTVDLGASIRDPEDKLMWQGFTTIGLQQDRVYCINLPGTLGYCLSLGQMRTKTYSPEEILTEKKIAVGVDKVFASLQKAAMAR